MPRPDGRIEPGQPIRGAISARAWNRAQDAADLVLGAHAGTSGVQGSPVLKPYTWCYCTSSVSVDRWGIVAITDLAINQNNSSFQDTPVLAGGMPSEDTTSWAVAVEPIAAGAIGRVAVSGVVQCRIENRSDFHPYVKCKASNTELMSAWNGEGFPLIKDRSIGSGKWGLVRIGHVFQRTTLLGTFDAPWPKGTAKTVSSGEKSFTVNNPFAEITGTGTRTCSISYLNYYESTYGWILTAAECV